jgi:uncharacterized membrane protein
MNNEEKTICKLRKKQSISELFIKSLKFFLLINIGVLTTSYLSEFVLGINKFYIYCLIGLYCSAQATYYKFRMFIDPKYKPDCNCYEGDVSFTDDAMNGILTVLEHKKGTLLFNIPNSVFGILFYLSMIVMMGMNSYYCFLIIKILNVTSCIGSIFLWYTMVTEVKSICILCTTIHCINFLSFLNIFF